MIKRNGKSETGTNIPPDAIAGIGRALFGQQWQAPLARLLKIDDSTLRRWNNDGCPSSLIKTMCSLLHARTLEIEKVISTLETIEDAQER